MNININLFYHIKYNILEKWNILVRTALICIRIRDFIYFIR